MKNSKKIIGGLIAIIVIVIIIVAIAINSGMIEKTPSAVKNTVVGEVYGQKITVNQVEENPQMKYVYQTLSQEIQGNLMENSQAKQYIIQQRGKVVQGLEVQAIVDKQVQDLKLIPTQADMDKLVAAEKQKFFAEIKQSQGIDVDEAMYLQMTGMTQAEFNNMITQQVKVQELSNYITKDVKVTENDAQTYYNENKDSQFTEPASADVYQIVVSTKEEAEKLRAQYENEIKGKNLTVAQQLAIFQKIASANNIDSTKQTGGRLTTGNSADNGKIPYNYSNFNKNFMTALNGLTKNGEISGVIDSSVGSTGAYNVIFINNYTAPKVLPFDKVKDQALKAVQTQENNQAISQALAKWEKEANMKTYTDRLGYPILDKTSTSESQSGTTTEQSTTQQSGTQSQTTEQSTTQQNQSNDKSTTTPAK